MKLKTRTNQPVYYKLPVSSDIEHLSDGLLNSLKVGDVVQKKTGNQKHCYIVTYKGDGAGEGICLTYVACGYMETISYDRSGSSWVFNSKDVVEVQDVTKAQSGTIQDVLGLNSSGQLVKGEVSGGSKVYKHEIYVSTGSDEDYGRIDFGLTLYNNSNAEINTMAKLVQAYYNHSMGTGYEISLAFLLKINYGPVYKALCFLQLQNNVNTSLKVVVYNLTDATSKEIAVDGISDTISLL